MPHRLISRLALLLVPWLGTACAHTPSAAARVNPACADPHDPPGIVSLDSTTAGPAALELHFYRTATDTALDHVTAGSRDHSFGGTADARGYLRLALPRSGRVPLRSLRLGYRPRLDTITVAADSVLWLRIGMARSFVDAQRCLGVFTVRDPGTASLGAGPRPLNHVGGRDGPARP